MTSETMTNAVSIKDYIIDMNNTTAKNTATYEVVLENNTDFIIKRCTRTTDRELVILVSKGLYYIKDCKSDNIDTLTESNLNSFLRELKDGFIQLHQVHWLPMIFKESAELIMRVVCDARLSDMCRHNVLVNTYDPTWYIPFWEQNSKLFIRLYNLFPNMADKKKYQSSLPVIFWIEKEYGANEAMYFAEKLAQSGISQLCFSSNGYYNYEAAVSRDASIFIEVMASPYNTNLRRSDD